MRTLAVSLAALTLVACTEGKPEPIPASPHACNADSAQRYLGQQATPRLVEKVRREAGATTARRITPNMRVTMEFRADRVNVWTGLKGEVERINCG